MDLILRPVRIAFSKQAQQTYLNTVLLLATSAVFLGLAAFAYILFYMSIPQEGIERAVHMQFGDGPNPYSFVSLGSSIVAQQAYDITLELDLPRSPPNLQAGNFMLDMALLSPAYKPAIQSSDEAVSIRATMPNDAVLFSSRRPAILTYHPRLVRLSKQVTGLPWYLLGWHRDAEKLEIVMAEGVSFSKGWRNVPNLVYLELQGRGQDIQVYDMQLKLRARFEGLKWLMYNHRIFSLVVLTAAFWTVEMLFAILTWILWSSQSRPGKEGEREPKSEETDGSTAIKTEKEEEEVETDDLDLSDTPRSFPTYGRQAPLKYDPKVKTEDDSEKLVMDESPTQPWAAEVADDESEEPIDVGRMREGRSDSGIGTGFSEGRASVLGGIQRRRSKGTKGPG